LLGDDLENWSNVRELIDTMHGRWVLAVLHNVRLGAVRPRDLRRAIHAQSPDGPVSPKVLSETLALMVGRGLLTREVISVAPPAVEYSLTPWGRAVYNAYLVLDEWTVTRPRDDVARGPARSGCGPDGVDGGPAGQVAG
jgi:DNA-binding HxlR family transcriptional regulator